MGRNSHINIGLVTAFLACVALATRPADFGNQWVKSHPFTITGASQNENLLDMTEYKAEKFSLFIPYGSANQIYTAAASPMNWMGTYHTDWNQPFDVDGAIQWIALFENGAANGLGWNLADEVIGVWMAKQASLVSHYKTAYPAKLTWVGATGLTLPLSYIYGSTPPSGYSADQYLDDLVSTIQPDILAGGGLSFKTGNITDHNEWFTNLMKLRGKTLASTMPFFMWIQAYSIASQGIRMPSESDLRAEIFASLVCGAKGIVYGGYSGWWDQCLLDNSGNPTSLYTYAMSVNSEVVNLGPVLRDLTSTDVRFVAGSGNAAQMPTALTAFTPGAGGDSHILSVNVDSSNPANIGTGKNGVIGFFTDSAGGKYFLLMNLYHGENMSATSTALDFRVGFDNATNQLYRLSRLNGHWESVPLSGNTLSVRLNGGTGNLYRYNPSALDPAALTGNVILDNYTGDLADAAVLVRVRQNNQIVATAKVLLDSAGYFSVPVPAAGTYDVTIKAYASKSNTISGVAVSAWTNIGTVHLANGDSDGDGEVSSSDLAIILNRSGF